MRPGLRRQLNPFIEPDFVAERVEKMKASIRAKVEHPFRVLKRQFGFTKVRYRGLAKNTAQIVTLFALGNLWLVLNHSKLGYVEFPEAALISSEFFLGSAIWSGNCCRYLNSLKVD
eukprot:gene18132-biopygen5350